MSTVFGVNALAGAPVDDAGKFLLLGIAVLASAWFAGTGPALSATVLGALLGAFEQGGPPRSDAVVSIHLALFIIQGLLLTAVVVGIARGEAGVRRAGPRRASRAS